MEPDETHELKEWHRATILMPTGRAISCENCFGKMDEEFLFNWHTVLCGSPMVIELAFCSDCVPEVILYKYKIRGVNEMTKELKHN